MTSRRPSTARGILVEAARRGRGLFLGMAYLNALFVLLALFLSPISAATSSVSNPLSQAQALPSFTYAGYQLLLHVISGFAAGGLSLDPATALVGAAVGPLIDLDHLGFFSGLPVDARVGHSVFMVALIVFLDWRVHFWGKGTRDLALFVSMEYSLHFAVAPPGFPLLGPLSATIFYFPRVVPAVLAAILAIGFLLDSRRSKRPASISRGNDHVAEP